MKTLADLKRDLFVGRGITMTYNSIGKGAFLDVERFIISKNTTGVKIGIEKDSKKGSFLDYPKAKLMAYDGVELNIFEAGYRHLTDEEKNIIDNVPSNRPENKERAIMEAMTDGSGLYWADKRYYKDLDSEYLAGYETVRGLKYDYNTKMVKDENLKGLMVLSYKLS